MKQRPGIVVHCADTFPDMDIGAAEIRGWHVDGNKWSDIGYHFVIRRDGTVEEGRDIDTDGAHAKGFNDHIGICMAGGKARDGRQACNFTARQWETLTDLLRRLMVDYGLSPGDVFGHNDVSPKDCPAFDVRAFMESWS